MLEFSLTCFMVEGVGWAGQGSAATSQEHASDQNAQREGLNKTQQADEHIFQ